MVFLASDEPHSNILQGIHCLPYNSFARASIWRENGKSISFAAVFLIFFRKKASEPQGGRGFMQIANINEQRANEDSCSQDWHVTIKLSLRTVALLFVIFYLLFASVTLFYSVSFITDIRCWVQTNEQKSPTGSSEHTVD